MKKQLFLGLLALAALLSPSAAFSQSKKEREEEKRMQARVDSFQNSFHYETGRIALKDGLATVNLPDGFKFLNAEQSRLVLEKLWNNPPDEKVLGMLFPKEASPLDTSVFAFVLTFDDMGYVKDDDADKIDYDEMMVNMKKEASEHNEARMKAGYESIEIIGWASSPFYDKQRKVLHWAKEASFGGSPEHTLNYDVRVLGRKGVLSMNAVGGMDALPLVKQNINGLVGGVEFKQGEKYFDFDPKMDKVAAYGIGALVAGKVLAKAGILVFLAKFFKPILIALAAIGAWVKKLLGRRNTEQDFGDGSGN